MNEQDIKAQIEALRKQLPKKKRAPKVFSNKTKTDKRISDTLNKKGLKMLPILEKLLTEETDTVKKYRLKTKINKLKRKQKVIKANLTEVLIHEFTGPSLSLIQGGNLPAYLASQTNGGQFQFTEEPSNLKELTKMYGKPIEIKSNNHRLISDYTNHTINRDQINKNNKVICTEYVKSAKYREKYDLEVEDVEGDFQVKE